MRIFLILNGYAIDASVDEEEQIILQLAAEELKGKAFIKWLRVPTVETTELDLAPDSPLTFFPSCATIVISITA